MWYKSSSNIKPVELDTTSSQKYVYVRKDIKEVERETMGEETEISYEYLEQKVKKDDWELYKAISNHDTDISDMRDALIELAEIITEG